MREIERCITETAASIEEITGNIKANANVRPNFPTASWWRDKVHIALVGGGPSLGSQIEELKDKTKYRYVMACGAVHDYLVEQGVIPDFCAIVDPDPIVIKYILKPCKDTLYLVASQCSPKVFEHLDEHGCQVYMWHADGGPLSDKEKADLFGEGTALVGGGCTIGTRAMILAIGMGFFNQDLFGFDTCLTNDYKHHVFDFHDPNVETVGNIVEIKLGGSDSPTFKVAEYMLGQLFDFKNILRAFANCLNVTVHGGGLLAKLMEIGFSRIDEVNKNGSAT